MPPRAPKPETRRQIRTAAAKRSMKVKIQKTDRKQTIRQVGHRRGGH